MSLSPQPAAESAASLSQALVHDLVKLQEAAQKINSTLDLDLLLDQVVNEVARLFGCIETCIYLRDFTTDEVVLAGVRGCTMHGKGARLKVGKQGMVGWVAATGQARYAPDVRRDPFYIACEPETLCEFDIPLKVRGQVIGVFSTIHHDLDAFPPEQRHLLEVLAGHIAIAVENARLFQQERAARQTLVREAEEAQLIQQSLFPKSSPLIPGFSVQAMCAPAGAVSGDWYDYIPLSGDRWGVVLADVSGKGMAAALLMSATSQVIRSWAESCETPGKLLARLNSKLMDELPAGRFVTMVYGVIDPADRSFIFANAGHPWPLLAETGASRYLPTQEGIPLGVAPGRYSEERVTLAPGSRLLFYSDGITEALNAAGEAYGTDRLCNPLRHPQVSAQSLLEQVREFCGPRPLADDATVVLIRCRD